MIEVIELVATHSVPGVFLLVACWGLLPGILLRIASLCYPRSDRRRIGLVQELHAKPLLMQPIWALQQAEVAIVEGLFRRLVARYRTDRRSRR